MSKINMVPDLLHAKAQKLHLIFLVNFRVIFVAFSVFSKELKYDGKKIK